MAELFPIDVSSLGSYSGSFSGSFFGNGKGITGISASNAISASYAATASYLSNLESELNNVLIFNLFIG